MIEALEPEVQEMIDRETKAWNKKSIEILPSSESRRQLGEQ